MEQSVSTLENSQSSFELSRSRTFEQRIIDKSAKHTAGILRIAELIH